MKKTALMAALAGLALQLSTPAPVCAQKTAAYSDPDHMFRDALELFEKEKYSAAMRLFEDYLGAGTGESLNRTSAEYHSAMCAAALYHPDGEKRLHAFIHDHPANIHARHATFALGNVYYKKRKYGKAIDWFEKTDMAYLDNEEVAEYYFKIGYCHYRKKEYDKASSAFHQILDTESKYRTAANYYYGHVAYANNNYNTALEAFENLKTSKTFGRLVPYYIVQIYYEQDRYDDLIAYGEPVTSEGRASNIAEINRLVGEAWFRKGKYETALTYLEAYRSNWPAPTRLDYYQIAYCQYKAGECEKAVANFEKVVNITDGTAQMAYYHLGECFLNSGNKQSARSSFQFASQMDFHANVKEDALFNYAKLSYELDIQPVAVKAFTEYVETYPASAKTDEANELLAQVYLTTRNYKDALEALNKISRKNTRIQAAYQKVAYFRAIEFFNDRDPQKAIDLFTKAIVTGTDPDIRSMAMYWKAEAFYSMGRYENAVKQYRIFLFNPGSVNAPMYHAAHYGLGYAHFSQEHYGDANQWFRKYVRKEAETDPHRYNDALVRIADGFFAGRDYVNALAFYTQASDRNAAASDYCLFQEGVIQGIEGRMPQKAGTMKRLIARYPKSTYVDDAVYETGTAYLAMNESQQAESRFKQIIDKHPNSTYVRKAKVNIALIRYNAQDDTRALALYKQVISDYPATPEAAEALIGVKNIYVNAGNPDQYFAYVKTVPFTSISTGAQDSITYEAAEQRYMKGEIEKASGDFDNYLQRFPKGVFALNAWFYRSECLYRMDDRKEALDGYENIISKPRNIFTEKSLRKAAGINYSLERYEAALDQFNRLEESADFKDNIIYAQAGKMRSNFRLGRYNAAGINARKVLGQETASAILKNEAHLTYGKVLLESREYDGAAGEFRALAGITNSAMGAEAKYELARISNLQGDYNESLKRCYTVINQVPSYDFWIANSFLLLADNYVALGDTFQAKHTLKSIIDNYESNSGDTKDIKAEAGQRYQVIIDAEMPAPRQEPEPGMETEDETEEVEPGEPMSPQTVTEPQDEGAYNPPVVESMN